MQWFGTIADRIAEYLKTSTVYITTMDIYDYFEIIILAFLMYYILVWVKATRAWLLLRGLIVILVFLLLAFVMDMSTIKWLARNVLSFAVVALIVVMQPELRRALENLGRRNFLPSMIFSDASHREQEIFSEKTINEITKACVEMGRAKTGALIVIEQKESLKEYERTGIDLDAIVSSQLLINIFEHNTPLHDGAVIIRGNRVTSATCYLPLTDNQDFSKELGTRHRAGVGVSEVTDSLIVIVSEETGKISVAYNGALERSLNAEQLKERLQVVLNNRSPEENAGTRRRWRGKRRNREQETK